MYFAAKHKQKIMFLMLDFQKCIIDY